MTPLLPHADRALVLLLAVTALTCQPSREEFYARTYTCNSTLGHRSCGTNINEQPMACFPARQLGAEDFCTDGCDGDVERSSTERQLCVASGARLTRCQPSREGQEPLCQPGFRCLRTDLASDEGVCMRTNVCTTDEDCPDPVRSTCAAQVLSGYYPKAGARLDHLYCVQEGCQSRGSACPPGETCLRNIVPPESRPPDICVPHCDSNLNCPPNHFCYKRVSGKAAPGVCIPGLLGFRCTSHVDCLTGECVPTGEADIRLCSVACEKDADCAKWNGPRGVFVCSHKVNGKSYCATAEAVGGSPCKQDGDCREPGARCTYFSPYGTPVNLGFCLMPCREDKTCPSRIGLPHTCFDSIKPEPVCYPGKFGMVCRSNDVCIRPMKCMPSFQTLPDDTETQIPACTVPCALDADCSVEPITAGGWCDRGACVLPRPGGRLCRSNKECASGVCRPSDARSDEGKGISRCTTPPGGAQ